ncbi:MAG: ATP-binding protein [Phycisphaerae bacterium]
MQLRWKFGCLALIYLLSLTANLVMSSWCIVVYFDSAFRRYESGLDSEQSIQRVRALLRQHREAAQGDGGGVDFVVEGQAIQRELAVTISMLRAANDLPSLAAIAAVLEESSAGRPSSASAPAARSDLDVEQLDQLLGRAAMELESQRQQSVLKAAATQWRVMQIILINAVCGVLLCLVGLIFVRRWVVRPVAALRTAAQHLAVGDFSHRIEARSRDELGLLACEVNQMASRIAEMQAKLVEQERLAGAAEMVERLAHNIRNPLAGIRGLAEATSARHVDDSETVECQRRITDTVDRFEKWLRDLQVSVSPMALHPQPANIGELIRQAITVLRPMLQRREVAIRVDVPTIMPPVHVDSMHFEQALVALLTNAVQASRPGQTVRVEAGPCPHRRNSWQLVVQDEGEGIAPEVRDKIFAPYFTTKRGGTGIGLTIAGRVAKAHGGEIVVDSTPGHGSRFVVILPDGATEA